MMNETQVSGSVDLDNNIEKNILIETGYSEKAIKYFMEKPFMGTIHNADHVSEMKGSCGDTMKLFLKIEDGIIIEAKYQVLGCPGAVSSAMALADIIKGKDIKTARGVNDNDVFKMLEDFPAKKHHCIQLSVKNLHKAIDEYTQIISSLNNSTIHRKDA